MGLKQKIIHRCIKEAPQQVPRKMNCIAGTAYLIMVKVQLGNIADLWNSTVQDCLSKVKHTDLKDTKTLIAASVN